MAWTPVVWKCDFPDCKAEVLGVGNAMTLNSIGWFVAPKPNGIEGSLTIRCLNHNPYSWQDIEKTAGGLQAALHVFFPLWEYNGFK